MDKVLNVGFTMKTCMILQNLHGQLSGFKQCIFFCLNISSVSEFFTLKGAKYRIS